MHIRFVSAGGTGRKDTQTLHGGPPSRHLDIDGHPTTACRASEETSTFKSPLICARPLASCCAVSRGLPLRSTGGPRTHQSFALRPPATGRCKHYGNAHGRVTSRRSASPRNAPCEWLGLHSVAFAPSVCSCSLHNIHHITLESQERRFFVDSGPAIGSRASMSELCSKGCRARNL